MASTPTLPARACLPSRRSQVTCCWSESPLGRAPTPCIVHPPSLWLRPIGPAGGHRWGGARTAEWLADWLLLARCGVRTALSLPDDLRDRVARFHSTGEHPGKGVV